jgi:hypothetical protein
MKRAYLLGLGSGDIEYAMLNASLYIKNCIDSLPINVLENIIRSLVDRMTFLGQEKTLFSLKPAWQFCKNLLGHSDGDPKALRGQVLTQQYLEDMHIDCQLDSFLGCVHMYSMILAYHFSDFEMAETFSGRAVSFSNNESTLAAAYCRLYDALTLLANVKKGNYWRRIRLVRRHLKVMRQWSKVCPENFVGKQSLVEAELAAVMNDRLKAQSKYYLAIIQSRDAGILMQEALANERFGKFYLSIGEQATAIPLLEEACRLYKVWGGVVKLAHLRKEIEQIFVA